jgi:DNA-binding response OmpR family regulator
MKKILLIEDDPAILIGLEEYLSSENYEILKSSDGRDGFDKALKTKPDLILLDISLPSLDGIQICKMLRENGFRNPIIMLTSRSESVDKIVGLEVGANDYVTKPFESRELLARIRANLRITDTLNENKTRESNGKLHRQLLAIMFTDMENYSKKMNEDEQLGLKLLKIHNGIMKETIERNNGKIVEIIGDAFLASFESAINSVSCGMEIQKRFEEYNKFKLEKERIFVRIGIHLGDIIEFEEKLKGDSLNIASRIQELAEPGTVYISENVFLAVQEKIRNSFKEIGTKNLKHIKQPVKVFEVMN